MFDLLFNEPTVAWLDATGIDLVSDRGLLSLLLVFFSLSVGQDDSSQQDDSSRQDVSSWWVEMTDLKILGL